MTNDAPAALDVAAAAKLREPFPADMIGKLPRVTCKACSDSPEKRCGSHRKERCGECGGYMTTAHIHLDYVGHAAVTDRLLQADPMWTWEPMATDPMGLPVLTDRGVMPGESVGLWINLTVLGVSRPGFGGGKNVKEAIGDAIRNAAMRFGVALDLWSKQDLHDSAQEASPQEFNPARDRLAGAPADWREIGKVITEIDPTISEWLKEATLLLYGTGNVAELSQQQQAEVGLRAANAVARIRDEVMRDGDFPLPTSDELRDVMAWAFGGVVVFPDDGDGPTEAASESEEVTGDDGDRGPDEQQAA